MSLQVWLPLNGDLHNQGLNNVIFSNNGATIDNNGKIGKCYSFNGTSNVVYNRNISINCNKLSMCCWIYRTTSHTGDGYISSLNNGAGYADAAIALDSPTSTSVCFVGGGNYSLTATISPNTWNHIAVTYDGVKVIGYLNGQKIGEVANTQILTKTQLAIGCRCNSTNDFIYYFPGKLNDFRLYDHALSAKEVEEIAKGLVLHYKLDNSNSNLLQMIPKSFNAGYYNAYQLNMTENLVADQTYTLQLWDVDIYHSAKTAAQTGVHVYWGGGSVKLLDWTGSTYFTAEGTTNYHADYLVKTFTPTSAWASGEGAANAWLNIYNSPSYVAGTCNMHIGAWKLEKGSIATPQNNNIIYDSSGYNNNGTIVGSLETTTLSPRYSRATKFDGVTSCIRIPYNEINPDRIFTVNLWFYKDALGSKSYETLFGGPSGFEMDTRAGAATSLSLYMTSTRGSTVYSPLNLNEWIMITMARNGTNEFYYVNGELKKTVEAKSMPSGQYRIGAWASDTGQNYYGEISDFRIYATALTAEQIKELYNTSMIVDGTNKIPRDLE